MISKVAKYIHRPLLGLLVDEDIDFQLITSSYLSTFVSGFFLYFIYFWISRKYNLLT